MVLTGDLLQTNRGSGGQIDYSFVRKYENLNIMVQSELVSYLSSWKILFAYSTEEIDVFLG